MRTTATVRVHGRVAGASISPPSAGPTTHAETSMVTSASVARSLSAGASVGSDAAIAGKVGVATATASAAATTASPTRSAVTARPATDRHATRRASDPRTSRSRRTWSPSEPTAQDSRTYGAIRAAPARPTTHTPCGPAPYVSQTSTSSSGHGSPMATVAQAYDASSRPTTAGRPRCRAVTLSGPAERGSARSAHRPWFCGVDVLTGWRAGRSR